MHHRNFRMLTVVLALFAAGCGSGVQDAVEYGPYDLAELMTNADAEKGAALYKLCRACHTLEENGGHKSGPALFGIFGSKAGAVPGFKYTEAMAASQVIWAPETVDPWLEAPAKFMPGSRMVFAGMRNPQDRADLIVYLQAETKAAE